MRSHKLFPILLLAAAACLLPSVSEAQLYAADRGCDCIYSYVDTFATVVAPDGLEMFQIGGLSLDHQGRLLMSGDFSPAAYVARIDPDTEDFEMFFPKVLMPNYAPVAVVPDECDDIYVLMRWAGAADETRDDPTPNDFIALLVDGSDPPVIAYTFPAALSVIDMKVRPPGAGEGNVVVMADDTVGGGSLFVELERVPGDTFSFVQTIADGGMMPADPTAFAFSPDGTIILVDDGDGLHYVDEAYGYVWGFGSAVGPGLADITIDSDGYIYLANILADRVRRYTDAGLPTGPAFGSDLSILRAITVAGYTPTPEGELVLVEPWEDVEITFEGISEAGFTSAVVETSSSRTSPAENVLPSYASLPNARDNAFRYVSLQTDAVYTGVLQVDLLWEGPRLFFASGTGDTFRDFTVTGSIEDARGTIPRFSEYPAPELGRADSDPTEVVLVEDTRDVREVVEYKFWRLARAMATPDTVPFCPWGAIHEAAAYRISARGYYNQSQYQNAIDELAAMNALIREYEGWCIPNSSAQALNDRVGRILGHSKTLMYSLDMLTWVGVDEAPTSVSLSPWKPARGECRMGLMGPAGSAVTVRIYDLAGRLVATVYEGVLPDGGDVVVWDGRDSSGHSAASGVYFARAEVGGELASSKVVYLK
jgi:hypothetical protein